MFQRKHDNLMKEKGEIAKENQSLVKQMEDLKSSTSTLFLVPLHLILSHLSKLLNSFILVAANLIIYFSSSEDNI
jgi:hypothetical protein